MKTRTLSGPWHGECRSRLPQGKTRWSRLNALWVWSRNQCFLRWFSICYFPLMIFAWCFHDFFHDFLWFSMIFPSCSMIFHDFPFLPQLDHGHNFSAPRRAHLHGPGGHWQPRNPRRRIPVVSYKSHYEFPSKPWMIWIFVYRFHIRFHTNSVVSYESFPDFGGRCGKLLLRNTPMMWFTYFHIYMIESHDYRSFLHP